MLLWVRVQHQQPLHFTHNSSWEAMESLHVRPRSSNVSCSRGWALCLLQGSVTYSYATDHPKACREGGFPKQDPQNKCTKQGPLQKWPSGENSWDWILCPSSRYKTLTEGEMSLHSGFAALEIRSQNLSSKPRQEEVPCLSEGK